MKNENNSLFYTYTYIIIFGWAQVWNMCDKAYTVHNLFADWRRKINANDKKGPIVDDMLWIN